VLGLDSVQKKKKKIGLHNFGPPEEFLGCHVYRCGIKGDASLDLVAMTASDFTNIGLYHTALISD
jgi:hypothetical protein